MENVLRIYFSLPLTIDARLNPLNRFDIAQKEAKLKLNQYHENKSCESKGLWIKRPFLRGRAIFRFPAFLGKRYLP